MAINNSTPEFRRSIIEGALNVMRKAADAVEADYPSVKPGDWESAFAHTDLTEEALVDALAQIKASQGKPHLQMRREIVSPDVYQTRTLGTNIKKAFETVCANVFVGQPKPTDWVDVTDDVVEQAPKPHEHSVVDSKDIGRHLAVLRGQATSGRMFNMAGRQIGTGSDTMGHRFAESQMLRAGTANSDVNPFLANQFCVACRINRAVWAKDKRPCASASMPLMDHDINHATGNCRRCGVTQVMLEDAAADSICRSSGMEHVRFKAEVSIEAAQKRVDDVVSGYLDGNGFGQVDGPPCAYFQVTNGHGQLDDRVVYLTYTVGERVAVRDGESSGGADTFEHLVDLLWKDIKARFRYRNNIVWRRRPIVDHSPDHGWRLSMRLALVKVDDFLGVRDNRVVGWHRDHRNDQWCEVDIAEVREDAGLKQRIVNELGDPRGSSDQADGLALYIADAKRKAQALHQPMQQTLQSQLAQAFSKDAIYAAQTAYQGLLDSQMLASKPSLAAQNSIAYKPRS